MTKRSTFKTDDALARLDAVLSCLRELGPVQPKTIAAKLGWPVATCNTYLRELKRAGTVVQADKDASTRDAYLKLADGSQDHMPVPKVAKCSYTLNLANRGYPQVKRVNAADVKWSAPIDPMRQFLFGGRGA